jgi:hypothetical protein
MSFEIVVAGKHGRSGQTDGAYGREADRQTRTEDVRYEYYDDDDEAMDGAHQSAIIGLCTVFARVNITFSKRYGDMLLDSVVRQND